jgi:hypothetical protein
MRVQPVVLAVGTERAVAALGDDVGVKSVSPGRASGVGRRSA